MTQTRWIVLFIFGAMFVATILAGSPARATVDSYLKVLLPLEELMDEGYCQQEVIAYDAISTAPDAYEKILSRVLVRPVNAFLHRSGPEKEDSIDVNPLSEGEPKLMLKVETTEAYGKTYKVTLGIADTSRKEGKATSEQIEKKIKLAFLYASRNIFTWQTDAKIFVSIDDSALRDSKTRQLLLAKQPHTRTSPAYIKLGKELRSKWCPNTAPKRSWSK